MTIGEKGRRCGSVICVVCAVVFIVACQGTVFNSGGGFVSEEDRIEIPDGPQTAVWKTRDLWLDYRYVHDANGSTLSGTVRFTDALSTNYSNLHDFHLGIIFLDKQGRVLAMEGLATGRGEFDPIAFKTKLSPPPGTLSMAFNYQGTALGGGADDGGSPSAFWIYPIHR